MIVFPPAKVNLGLNVIRKRPDGFHDIETVMIPVPLTDALEAIIDTSIAPGTVVYSRSGLRIDGDVEKDLVMRAHRLLLERVSLPGIRMHLHKRVPMGAGLGGGSSDGAHALMLLNRLAGSPCLNEELHAMAIQLGSDCPFFLDSRAMLASGRGEVLYPVSIELNRYWLLLVNPGVAIPTAEVYEHVRTTGSELGIDKELVDKPMALWRSVAPNVMEEYVFRTRPIVKAVCERMIEIGAEHAAMSGSGSTVFGIFKQEPPSITWPAGVHAWSFQLRQ